MIVIYQEYTLVKNICCNFEYIGGKTGRRYRIRYVEFVRPHWYGENCKISCRSIVFPTSCECVWIVVLLKWLQIQNGKGELWYNYFLKTWKIKPDFRLILRRCIIEEKNDK